MKNLLCFKAVTHFPRVIFKLMPLSRGHLARALWKSAKHKFLTLAASSCFLTTSQRSVPVLWRTSMTLSPKSRLIILRRLLFTWGNSISKLTLASEISYLLFKVTYREIQMLNRPEIDFWVEITKWSSWRVSQGTTEVLHLIRTKNITEWSRYRGCWVEGGLSMAETLNVFKMSHKNQLIIHRGKESCVSSIRHFLKGK